MNDNETQQCAHETSNNKNIIQTKMSYSVKQTGFSRKRPNKKWKAENSQEMKKAKLNTLKTSTENNY